MNISKITKFGIASLLAGIACGAAGADELDLQARLEAAEARIAELSASDSNNWLNDKRADETRQLVHDVLADADSRSSMLGDGSPVTVNVHGFLQTRWSYNDTKTDGVDATHGFNVPRTRLELSGDLYDWGYKVSGQWNDGDDFTLMDAYAEKSGFRFGQFKSPFMKEVLTEQNKTLAVDRTVIAQEFGQGRSQGIQYSKNFGFGDLTVAYTDGFNTANGAGVVNGYALTGRLDFEPTNWLNAGVAVSHNNLDTTDFNTWTADASVSYNSIKLTGAYVKTSGSVGDNWGTVWTLSTDIKYGLDVFAQYESGHLDGVDTDLSIATVGFNYLLSDNVKWTTDFGKSFNGIDAGWNLANTGWNSTASDGEYLIRSQMTVSF